MKLLIHGKLAEVGMEVITGRGEKGTLQDWKEPHKQGSSGRVYIQFADRHRTSEYFPGVIGGKWTTDELELYDKIGKEFEDYDFTADPQGEPPPGWSVETNETNNIEYMEIQLPDYEGDVPKLEEIKTFTYVKRSQVVKNYIFTRKE